MMLITQDLLIKKNIEELLVEKEKQIKKYPIEWLCDISNNGKILALYDKS